MILAALILFGIFINFFGREVFYIISKNIYGIEVKRLIPTNDYYNEAMFDLSILYLCILLYMSYRYLKIRKVYSLKRAAHFDFLKLHHSNRYKKYYFTVILILFTVFLFSIQPGDATTRGFAAHEQATSFALLNRLKILAYPLLIYFVTLYKLDYKSLILVGGFFLVLIAFEIISGGRRELGYIFISFIGLYYQKVEKTSALFTVIMILVMLSFFTFSIIMQGGSNNRSITLMMLGNLLASIGDNGLIWQVKSYTENITGFFYGSTFFTYIVSLLIPSPILIAINDEFGDILTSRGSDRFDEMYNTSVNHGYDFMMVADFYWEFGYIGYFLYFIFTVFILNYCIRNYYSPNKVKQSMSIIVAFVFIAGQRSDLLFSLKIIFYSFIFIHIIKFITNIKILK